MTPPSRSQAARPTATVDRRVGPKVAPGRLKDIQALINTWAVGQPDQLATAASSHYWLASIGAWPLKSAPSTAEVKHLTRLRFHLRMHLLKRPETKHAGCLNGLLSSGAVSIAFRPDSSIGFIHSGKRLDHAFSVLSDIIATHAGDGTWQRLKCCPECGWCYYDGTKNRSGKWCSMEACGSRMKSQRYRQRRKRESA